MKLHITIVASFFLLILLSINMNASDDSIVLSMQDIHNKSIRQAMIQSPFILQLELNNNDLIDKDIKYISGMDSFKHSPAMRHSHTSTYNGKTVYKIIYRFVLQTDKKGTYTVGPFSLKDKTGKFIKSNRLIITVADTIIASDQADAIKFMIQSKLDQKNVYIGEKTTLYVEFFDRIFVDKLTIELPEFENLQILSVVQDEATMMQHIHGYDYAVTKWAINFYPKYSGLLTIDDIKVTFLDQRLENTSRSKGVFRRFGSMMKVEREQLVNPVQLSVSDLPKKEGFQDVIAVGQLSKLVISVNKKSLEEGQGFILTTELFGNGNFEMMHSIPLTLPYSFQSYDANTTEIDTARTCKHSEFIVQAQEQGSFYIVPQKLNYFDPTDKMYKTLQSNSIDIVVTANPHMQKNKDHESLLLVEDNKSQEIDDKNNVENYKILDSKLISLSSPRMFPVQWYTLLLLFLFCILLMMMAYRYGLEKYIFPHERWQHFIIFLQAKKACKLAARKNNSELMYKVFIDLFIALKISSAGTLYEEQIEQYFRNKNFSEEQIMQWRYFYSRLLQASFAQYDQSDKAVLFQESLVWLQQLKEKV